MAYSVTSFNKENLRCPCCGAPVEFLRIFLPDSRTELFDLRHGNWATQTAYGRRNHPSLSDAFRLSRHEFLASPKELGAIINARVEEALGRIAKRCSKETESAPKKILGTFRPFGESPRKLFL